jgi:FKBP-type peptidyl-prolyl cis-trans isomerase FkpA
MKIWLIVGAVVIVVVAIVFVALRDQHEDTAPVAATPTAATSAEASAAPPAMDYASIQAAYLDENIKKPGWKATGSGLQYHVLKAADDSAPKPAPGSVVTINYEGRLIDGTVFDSTNGKAPFTYALSSLIPGWQEGVPMMHVGETWEFAIPAGLAYGPDGTGPIPGGSTLIFKIELLAAKTPAQ